MSRAASLRPTAARGFAGITFAHETYNVLRLPARRTDPWTEIPIAGIRAGERKTC
jgi:hypothetical protein